jgi:hypothetical protein
MKKFLRRLLIVFLILVLLLAGLAVWFSLAVKVKDPEIENSLSVSQLKRTQIAENVWTCGDNWLRKNNDGLFELYVSGEPYELGYKNGLLTQDLVQYQEEVFVQRLMELIPSKSYLKFLRYFVAWFNKDMDEYVPLAQRQEIYGVSRLASPDYDFIAPAYHRILNYHGAHDIGHALQNLNLVGCTAFAAWGNRSADSSMIIGRNFDFYMSDEFARDKIVAFYRPSKGYNFAFVTWGGMTGVVSGMNVKGLTVTLNSAKSSIPISAKMPVSLLAREILQYASNISEAYAIAQKYQTFVSESCLIGSAADNKVVVIEKSAEKVGLYQTDGNEIVLTNHFQSDEFKNDSLTVESRREGASEYRYQRVQELMAQYPTLDIASCASILRDRKGLRGTDIGNGNEKAVNQLIAHHSVIFKPSKLQMWVSTSPFQVGKYEAYDLNVIFNTKINPLNNVNDSLLTINADTFLTNGYNDYNEYRSLSQQLTKALDDDNFENQFDIDRFINLNPRYFHTYLLAGRYYFKKQDFTKAQALLMQGLSLEIPRVVDRENLEEWLQKSSEAMDQ